MQRDLVERARAGDVEAFTALVEDRLEGMFRTAMAILGREADARDAVQEALTLVWQRLPQLRDPDRFEAWAARVLLNACRMARRRGRDHVREIPMSTLPAEWSKTRNGVEEGHGDRTARLDLLERAFNRLEVDDRALLVLHHLDGRPLTEIGELLGVPEGTVKSRLHAARRALERAIELEKR